MPVQTLLQSSLWLLATMTEVRALLCMAPGPISVNKIKNMCSFQTEANPLINLEIGKQLIDLLMNLF